MLPFLSPLMAYDYYKALHIIFVVTWFAGLFYIVRLFIYHVEANTKQEPEKSILCNQFSIMEKRLFYGITWPSMILTLIFGTLLLIEMPHFLKNGYMHLKIILVIFLILYHFSCQVILKQLNKGFFKYNSNQLRIWNELATLFLVSIVFLIVLKNAFDFLWGILGLILFSVILLLSIKIYKKIRQH